MCNVEGPPPEPWVPMRPFSERVVGRPSRCTLPFVGTVRSFCHVLENVDFRLPLEGERADEPPEGFFTLYEEHLMRARLWFPIPSVIVEFLNRLEVSIMHNPIPPFPEDLCVVRNLLRGGPLFWGTSLPRGSSLQSKLIDLVSVRRLMMTWGCFLKIPPCMLSMPLGRAVVKGRPRLRMMQNRPLRIPSLV
ncbi:unnamed protein product, partial [Brassica rapa subsp. narinosa]